MSQFRRKPVVVEAMRFVDGASGDVLAWARERGSPVGAICFHQSMNRLHIITLEGQTVAAVGDWVIRGVKGEFYPCKPDIFEATYEPV